MIYHGQPDDAQCSCEENVCIKEGAYSAALSPSMYQYRPTPHHTTPHTVLTHCAGSPCSVGSCVHTTCLVGVPPPPGPCTGVRWGGGSLDQHHNFVSGREYCDALSPVLWQNTLNLFLRKQLDSLTMGPPGTNVVFIRPTGSAHAVEQHSFQVVGVRLSNVSWRSTDRCMLLMLVSQEVHL